MACPIFGCTVYHDVLSVVLLWALSDQSLGGGLVVQARSVLYADWGHVFPRLPGRVETGDRWPRERRRGREGGRGRR